MAESRYHPVEGELLGVTWTLQKTQYYTLGTEKILILVDHKPLLGLLSSKNLDDIDNPRLLHLAERLIRWSFGIQHIAGAKNFAPDALSHYPARAMLNAVNSVKTDDHDSSSDLEAQILATAVSRRVIFTSWDQVRLAGISDDHYAELLHLIQSDENQWPESHAEYKRHRHDLSSVHGAALFKGRVIIPPSLRSQVLTAIHHSHQGTSGMTLRAHD